MLLQDVCANALLRIEPALPSSVQLHPAKAQCARPDIPSTYHAGPSEDGGFVWLRIPLTGASPTQAVLYQVPVGAPAHELKRIEW